MTIKIITTSTIFALTTLLYIQVGYAGPGESEVVSIGGREVILNSDGSWEYVSTDRYVNTRDGTRVRLKNDGTWQTADDGLITSGSQVRTNNPDIKIKKVVIETYKKKKQKNTSVKTQTVFYVSLGDSSQIKQNLEIKKDDITLIEVKDSTGRMYRVLSIVIAKKQLQPSTDTTLIIRAEKSPPIWDDVKSMEIVFKTGMLGIEKPITLSQKTSDFDEKEVSGF